MIGLLLFLGVPWFVSFMAMHGPLYFLCVIVSIVLGAWSVCCVG